VLDVAFYGEAERDCQNAILVCDCLGCIDWVNRYFEEMTGYKPGEVVGRRIENILRGPDTESYGIYKIHQAIRRGKGVSHLELTYYRNNRSRYRIKLTVMPVLSVNHQEVVQYVIYQRPIHVSGWQKWVWLRKITWCFRHPAITQIPNLEPVETQPLPEFKDRF
jgi:PAS domain S-box-containing protein